MAIITARESTPTTPAPVQVEAPKLEEALGAVDKPKEEQISPKFAALAREQRALHKMREELKAERAAIEAEKTTYKTKYIDKDRIKTDFLSVMTEAGLTPDEVVSAISNHDPQSATIQKLMAKIDSLEQKQTSAEKAAIENQQKAYDNAVNNVRNEVKLLVDSNSDYETIKANDAQEAVVELIKETFEKENRLMTTEEASKIVENYLLEEAVKMASLEKVKQRLLPKAPEQVKAPIAKQQQTLTHANTTAQTKPLTPKERRERAIAAFRGQLA